MDPERTIDGRYIIVSGRRWRATDPRIPDNLRTELVAELMDARRLVRSDAWAARPRVHDAKVALGERGDPWWAPTGPGVRHRAECAARTLLRHRHGAPVTRDELARIVAGDSADDTAAILLETAAALVASGQACSTGAGLTPGANL